MARVWGWRRCHRAFGFAGKRPGKPACSEFEIAEIFLLDFVALDVGKTLEWDGPNTRARSAPEAAQFVKRDYREG